MGQRKEKTMELADFEFEVFADARMCLKIEKVCYQ